MPPSVTVYRALPCGSLGLLYKYAVRVSSSHERMIRVVHACAYDSPNAGTSLAPPPLGSGFTVTWFTVTTASAFSLASCCRRCVIFARIVVRSAMSLKSCRK